MDTETDTTGRQALLGILRAPIELRSYTNLLYLLLAFPLGLTYFLFLTVGLSVGLGLAIVWVGVPILVLVLLASRGLTAVERRLAIGLLGAEVPPMAPMAPISPMSPPPPAATAARPLWQQLGDVLTNPVTWKGMAFQLLKFPLGLATFVFTITLSAFALALLLTPFFYTWSPPELFGWEPETLGGALLCSALGLVVGWIALNLFNALAWLWKALARVALGSASFLPPPALPAETTAA